MQLDTSTYRKDLKYPTSNNETGRYHGYGRLGKDTSPKRDTHSIRSILIHTTNNPLGNTNYAPEAVFLRDSPDVSIGYVVSSHDDTIAQVLPDTFIAWHSGDCLDNEYENSTSIGIEIAWTINKGPLPPQAITNVTDLVRFLIGFYPWISKIDMHRAQAIFSNGKLGRKIDPSGWTDKAFYAWRDTILFPQPASIRAYRVTMNGVRIRAQPTNSNASGILGTRNIGTIVEGEMVIGTLDGQPGQWLKLTTGGYMAAIYLESR